MILPTLIASLTRQKAAALAQRNRFAATSLEWSFHNGQFQALRDVLLEIHESSGEGLPDTAHSQPSKLCASTYPRNGKPPFPNRATSTTTLPRQ